MPKVKRIKFIAIQPFEPDADWTRRAPGTIVTALQRFYDWQDEHPQVDVVSVIEKKGGFEDMDITVYYKPFSIKGCVFLIPNLILGLVWRDLRCLR